MAARPAISSSPFSHPDATTFVVRVARDDARALRVEALGQLEERAVDVEAVGRGRHAVADRVLRVDFDVENRPGRENAGRASDPFFRLRTGIGSFSIARSQAIAHRDQRAAGGDELLELPTPASPMPPRVLRPNLIRVVAVDDPAWILIGDDDRVEALAQLAGANVGRCGSRSVELVLLEHPPRPSLVHVPAGPRLIHRHARRVEENVRRSWFAVRRSRVR